jgi:hypothetical protein
LRALAADPNRAARLAEASLETARALTWDARAKRLEAFLAARLAAPPGGPVTPDPWTVSSWLHATLRWLFGG